MTARPKHQTVTTRARLVPAPEDPIARAIVSLHLLSGRGLRPVLTSAERPPLVRVAIADDDPLARLAIGAMVKRCDGLMLVGAASGVREIVSSRASSGQRPSCWTG
jgi:hypothetical protein